MKDILFTKIKIKNYNSLNVQGLPLYFLTLRIVGICWHAITVQLMLFFIVSQVHSVRLSSHIVCDTVATLCVVAPFIIFQ